MGLLDHAEKVCTNLVEAEYDMERATSAHSLELKEAHLASSIFRNLAVWDKLLFIKSQAFKEKEQSEEDGEGNIVASYEYYAELTDEQQDLIEETLSSLVDQVAARTGDAWEELKKCGDPDEED